MGRERTRPGSAVLRTRNPPAPQAWQSLGFTRAWSQMILGVRVLLTQLSGIFNLKNIPFSFSAYLSPCIYF